MVLKEATKDQRVEYYRVGEMLYRINFALNYIEYQTYNAYYDEKKWQHSNHGHFENNVARIVASGLRVNENNEQCDKDGRVLTPEDQDRLLNEMNPIEETPRAPVQFDAEGRPLNTHYIENPAAIPRDEMGNPIVVDPTAGLVTPGDVNTTDTAAWDYEKNQAIEIDGTGKKKKKGEKGNETDLELHPPALNEENK